MNWVIYDGGIAAARILGRRQGGAWYNRGVHQPRCRPEQRSSQCSASCARRWAPRPGAAPPVRRAPRRRREHAERIPNDPLFSSQQRYLEAIHTPEAWALQTGDPGILVAVIDSGVDIDHPDLAANIWTNPAPGSFGCDGDLHGCSFLDSSRSANCPPAAPPGSGEVAPTTPHGTFVAGVDRRCHRQRPRHGGRCLAGVADARARGRLP